jgi:hypothetical protein
VSDEWQSYGRSAPASDVTMPVVWKGKDGEAIRSTSPVVHPDEMDPLEREMLTETFQTCGGCKYFERAHGQAEMVRQRFVERLVREDNWQVRHLVSPLNELGICGAHDSGKGGEQTLTGTMHKACDQWRPARGKLSVVRRSTDG